MTNRTLNKNMLAGFIVIIIVVAGIITIIFTPFTIREWTVTGDDYKYQTFFYGYWNLYKDGVIISEGGSGTLTNFPIFSLVLIIIGLVSSFILVPSLGFSLNRGDRYFKHFREVFSILVIICGIIGLAGTLLQIPFVAYLKSLHAETKYSIGFIFATIYFSLIIISGILLDIFIRLNKKKSSSDIN